ncbi:MAG: hypothetical protein KDA29_12630 [Phycisphaerales bacterium]|nr:hypothetical protein [Phycisphaerales bacterium]
MKWAISALLACITVPAFGSISRTTIPVPGGFAQAGVSPIGQGFFLIVGDDIEPLYNDPGDDFSEGSFSGIGPITRSASAASMDASGSSSSEIGMGYINFVATNTAPNTTFGNAGAHGGFKENFIVTGGTPGTEAWMLVQVSIDGTMNASGFAGRAALNIGAFKDDIELRSSEPFWDNGNSDPISTDRQRATWGLSTSSFDENLDRTVSDMITFSVPITLGEPFNLGIYAFGNAGKRSAGGVAGSSSAAINFSVDWAGAQVVDAGGTAISGAAITGDTGLNWTSGPTPCPPDLAAPFGVLNFFDVSAFITAFTAQDPAADFAAPFGSFDFFDVSAFITAYNAGCP